MNIASARWANPEQTAAIINDEIVVTAREDELFQYLRAWLAAGHRPEPFRDLADVRRARVLQTRREARRRILRLMPGWRLEDYPQRQLNLLMQVVRKMYDVQRALAAGDVTRANTILDALAASAAIGDRLVAIRTSSDKIETAVMAAPDPVAYDVANENLWPP